MPCTVGVIGAGQLGLMLAEAGNPLGIDFVFLDPAKSPCATSLGEHICAEFDDPTALQRLVDVADVVTYEFENADVIELHQIAERVPVLPDPAILEIAQQRNREKAFFERIGIPVARWAYATSESELSVALENLQLPVVVKTNRFGYDGKGQQVVREPDSASGLFARFGSVPLTIEQFVDFDYEVAVLGTRAADGSVVVYPLTQNRHEDGILRESRALPADHPLCASAAAHLQALVSTLNYVGTVAVEFFVSGSTLIGNEFAPRVHNSGHWTIEGAATSQFENHLRAICGLPLGRTETLNRVAMKNFVGAIPDRTALLAIDGLHLHDYGKTPRPGRKVGHATIVAADDETLLERLQQLACTVSSI